MAAEALAQRGVRVTVHEAMPTAGRKFLMAGKSGLNLTKDEPFEVFQSRFFEANDRLAPILAEFGPAAVVRWAEGLGQPVFTGSSGRVFPKAMKASPLLRSWLARLADLGVTLQTRSIWRGWEDDQLTFETPSGPETVEAQATVLALGGASWARLGSNGLWTRVLSGEGVKLHPFEPANMGLQVAWSDRMARHFGTPLKPIGLRAGDESVVGECVISNRGLEGSAVYALSRPLRAGADLSVDLIPGRALSDAANALSRPWGKTSLANVLRKALRLSSAKIALAQEMARPLPREPAALAQVLKSLPISYDGPRPLDEAISVAGGLPWSELDDSFMLKRRPGTYACGEMLDWEAPTGGYLITACLATGLHAGRAAADALGAIAQNSTAPN
ncbi:MAG: TIGR03862 family flavoprotein [Planctomycetota bacterium]